MVWKEIYNNLYIMKNQDFMHHSLVIWDRLLVKMYSKISENFSKQQNIMICCSSFGLLKAFKMIKIANRFKISHWKTQMEINAYSNFFLYLKIPTKLHKNVIKSSNKSSPKLLQDKYMVSSVNVLYWIPMSSSFFPYYFMNYFFYEI